jgi:lipopolysaccharide biosynthesis protein
MTDDEIRRAPRLCFFAHYHPRGVVADYVLHYLAALAEAGFTVVVLSTADLPEVEQAKLRGAAAMLIMRENVGLDFGGWIQAWQRFAPIEADLLLLTNDSVYGPIHSLSAFVDRLLAVPADFYGAVESLENGRHLQSWFLLLRRSAFTTESFDTLMRRPIPPDLPKIEIIREYEMKLLAMLTAEGKHGHAAFGIRDGIGSELPYNPAHLLWKTLVARYRIPFIKIELLRDNPCEVGGVHAWRNVVRRTCRTLVPMIEADLTMREGRPFKSLRQRMLWSRDIERIDYWPELRPLIIAEAQLRHPPLRMLVLRIYRRALQISNAVRRRLRYRYQACP